MLSSLAKGTPSDPEKFIEVRRKLDRPISKRNETNRSYARVTGGTGPKFRQPVSAKLTTISPEWKFQVGENDVNIDSRNRTVILKLRGRNCAATTIEDILAAFTANGIDADDVSAIYKAEDQREVHITFESKRNTDELLKYPSIDVTDQVKGDVLPVRSNFHEVRVHWVPDFLNDSILKNAFGRVGKIRSIDKAWDRNVRYGSVRLVKLEINWQQVEKIPHLMEITYEGRPHRLLITIKGRPPLCLICAELGHTRRFCPESPAAKAQRFVEQRLQDIDSDSEDEATAEPKTTNENAPVTDNAANATAEHRHDSATDCHQDDSNAATSADPHPPPVCADPSTNSDSSKTNTPPDTQADSAKKQGPDADATSLAPSSSTESLTQPHDPPEKEQLNSQASESATWAEEMEAEESNGEEEMNSVDLEKLSYDSETEIDTQLSQDFSNSSIPCAQPEKHESRANKRKNTDHLDSQSRRRGRGRGLRQLEH